MKIRYGVIGAGTMGLEHIGNVRALENAEVTALADPSRDQLDIALQVVEGEAVAFTDHRELLASGLVDAVVVAVPNHLHHPVLTDVLAGDVHVMVEKPLCIDVGQCIDVIRRSQTTEKVVWMGLEYRFMPPIAALLRHLDDGAIGTTHMVAIREHRFPFLPKVGDWNRFRANTGGTLVEKCCHFFDLMNLVAGALPTRVMASGGQAVNHLDERYDGARPDIIDNAFVIVEYENGIRASMDLCMFAEGGPWEQEVVVTGDEGRLEAFVPFAWDERPGVVRTARRDAGGWTEAEHTDERVGFSGGHHGSSFLEHLHFVEAIETGTPAAVTLEDGLWSVAVGQAAHLSIDEARSVTIAEVLPTDWRGGDPSSP